MTQLRNGQSASAWREHLTLLFPVLFGMVARAACWNTRPPDMSIFLEPWFNHLVRYGPIGGFAHPFSNYEPAYLYLLALGSLAHGWLATMTIIKLISVAGTLFMTLAVATLLRDAGAKPRDALLVLILPSFIYNDALLGQCDALCAGSCVFALAAMIRGQTLRAMLWCGLAISLKAQAAFIAPVMIGAMIGRRAPLWQWLVPAAVFAATLLPPWLLGWPGMQLLTVYIQQAAWDQIPGRLGNPWMFATMFADQSANDWFGIGYVLAVAAAVLIAALAARAARDPRHLILLGALSGTALPFLLPKMLERYYFLGDVLTLVLALTWKSREAWSAMRAVQAASIVSLVTYVYFYFQPYPALIAAACATAGLVLMCRLAAPQVDSLVSAVRSKWEGRLVSGLALRRP